MKRTKAQRQRLARIYRRAATLGDATGGYSCHMIQVAQDKGVGSTSPARSTYENLFDCAAETFGIKFSRCGGQQSSTDELLQIRVLALCLAAAIAEAGDLPE